MKTKLDQTLSDEDTTRIAKGIAEALSPTTDNAPLKLWRDVFFSIANKKETDNVLAKFIEDISADKNTFKTTPFANGGFLKGNPSNPTPTKSEIKFGNTVKDTVTGFTGIVTALAQYATGCNQVQVQPKIDKDEKWVEAHWFDIERIKHVPITATITINSSPTGGDRHSDTPPTR